MLKNPVQLFFLFIGMVATGYAQGWQSSDSDTSLAHFPVKFIDELPHSSITENIVPFAVGTAATAFDWAVLD